MLENNNGTVLLMTLLILTSILVVALGAANLVMPGVKMSGTQERSTIAYFAAEAGAERVLWEIRRNGFDVNECDITTNKYVDFSTSPASCDSVEHSDLLSNNASYSVIYISNSPDLQSIGGYFGVKRIVEIGY